MIHDWNESKMCSKMSLKTHQLCHLKGYIHLFEHKKTVDVVLCALERQPFNSQDEQEEATIASLFKRAPG